MKCSKENCDKIATRSTLHTIGHPVYCEKHYWENADGSSVEEEVAKRHYEVKGNYD